MPKTAPAPADPRYPIGGFSYDRPLTAAERKQAIADFERLPARLRAAAQDLKPKQLDTPYREGGWTLRQVVHHVADSHMNGYVRLKLALTEDEPTIKPYEEGEWAKLADTRETPVEAALALVEGLHTRWVALWRSMAPADFQRRLRHPASGVWPVEWLLALYAWHGRHHVAHVTTLRKKMGW